MKKLITLLLAATFGLSMVACSSAPDVKADAAPAAAADSKADDASMEAPKKSLKKNEGNRSERAEEDE